MPDVVMPRLSDSMEEGTVLAWMKAVGDEVAVGDELVEIETDKANMVYESDVAGTLTEIVAEEGATLPIGEVIARVGEAGEALEQDLQLEEALFFLVGGELGEPRVAGLLLLAAHAARVAEQLGVRVAAGARPGSGRGLRGGGLLARAGVGERHFGAALNSKRCV